MYFEGLARSCIFVFTVHVAFLDEEGWVVQLVGNASEAVCSSEDLLCFLTFGTVCMAATNRSCEKCLGIR